MTNKKVNIVNKIMIAFSALVLVIGFSAVATPAANASSISCSGTTLTLEATGDATGLSASSISGCSDITSVVITGSIDQIRGTLTAVAGYISSNTAVAADITSITLQPTDETITVNQQDLDYIAYIAGQASLTSIALIVDAAGHDVVLDGITEVPTGLTPEVIDPGNPEALAEELATAGLGSVVISVEGTEYTADNIVAGALNPEVEVEPKQNQPGTQAGEQKIAPTADAFGFAGFGVIAVLALAGAVVATRKYASAK